MTTPNFHLPEAVETTGQYVDWLAELLAAIPDGQEEFRITVATGCEAAYRTTGIADFVAASATALALQIDESRRS